jgi:hypothetical protein
METFAVQAVAPFALDGNDVQNAMLYGEGISGNYFQVVKPRLQPGRAFLPEEGRTAGRDPVVVQYAHCRTCGSNFIGPPATKLFEARLGSIGCT